MRLRRLDYHNSQFDDDSASTVAIIVIVGGAILSFVTVIFGVRFFGYKTKIDPDKNE